MKFALICKIVGNEKFSQENFSAFKIFAWKNLFSMGRR